MILALCCMQGVYGARGHGMTKGVPYQSLKQWSYTEGLQYSKMGRSITLKSKDHHRCLKLELQRREVSWNANTLYLGMPILTNGNDAAISTRDIEKYLSPLLHGIPPHSVTRITLDPGHGGKDCGTQYNSLSEKQLTLDIALRTKRILERYGFLVAMTRTQDVYLDLETRTQKARHDRADLFISIHINSEPSTEGAVYGLETFVLPPAGHPSTTQDFCSSTDLLPYRGNAFDITNTQLGFCIHQSLKTHLQTCDRGLRRARFKVLKEAPCPAVLIECGFISNRYEANRLRQADYRQKIADAIAQGVVAYKRGLR